MKLSDHKFKKGKFTTPWNEFMKAIGKENSWYHGRLPEYLWLALIIDYYGRESGLHKCNLILRKLRESAPDFFTPKFSKILKLDPATQITFYKCLLDTIDVCVLGPLTAIFTYSRFPQFASTLHSPQLSIDDRIRKVNEVIARVSNHQSHLSTDVRFLVLYFNILSGRFHMPQETLDLILEYPELSHDDEKMRMIRPMIRSMEIVPIEIDPYDEEYLSTFWEEISRMSDCELFYINLEEKTPESQIYMTQVKTIFDYYSDLLVSARPLDNKMLVLLGIATYSYKRLLELVEHKLYNSISGRSIVRVLIEDYIMMKYLLQNESAHDDIWSEYQYYGIGQYKLIVERYRESGKDLPNSHVFYDYLDALVSEYKNKDFIDMDTSYFGKQNIREKAASVGEKELFGLYYDYDSAFEHGLWGAIRESSLIKCKCAAHQYHCIPDVDNKQNLKSAWADCVEIMNQTIEILRDVYGLPAHLIIGAEKNGE